MSRPIQFQVEYVLARKQTTILARQITPGSFVLDDRSTLNGCRLQPHVSIPRSLDSAGQQRTDIFAFTLHDRSHSDKFVLGQIVELVTA